MKLPAIILGITGNVLSILVLASPMLTFWRIVKKRSVESFSAFPYVCSLLSNMMWLYYGILDQDGVLLITVASTGCALQTFYLSIYMLFAKKLDRIILTKQLVAVLIIYSAILVFTIKFAHGSTRLRSVGFLCALNSVLMYASPLTMMKMVITTKSVEYMPFLLSLSLFLCGGVWFAYAMLMKDLYLEISNGSGLCLGFMQLVLYALYYNVACQKQQQRSATSEQENSTTPWNVNSNYHEHTREMRTIVVGELSSTMVKHQEHKGEVCSTNLAKLCSTKSNPRL